MPDPHAADAEISLTRYVLGLRRAGGQTDHATSYPTAAKTVEAAEAWRAEGGTVTVILRAGQPVDDRVLRRDARNDHHIADHLRRLRPSPRKTHRP